METAATGNNRRRLFLGMNTGALKPGLSANNSLSLMFAKRAIVLLSIGLSMLIDLKYGWLLISLNIHAEGLRIGNDIADGQKFGNVIACFVRHTQVFVCRLQTLRAGAVDSATDVTFRPV